MKKLILITLCLSAGLTYAIQETLQPGPGEAEDVFIWEHEPHTNYEDNLLACGYETGFMPTLIRFAELDDPRFDDCTINSAILALYPDSSKTWGTPPLDATFYMIVESWDPATITWSSRPVRNWGTPLTYSFSYDNDWHFIDVTTFVSIWVEDNAPNHGLIFGTNSTDKDVGYAFCNGEITSHPEYRPKLIIYYEPDSAVETASWGAIKAGN